MSLDSRTPFQNASPGAAGLLAIVFALTGAVFAQGGDPSKGTDGLLQPPRLVIPEDGVTLEAGPDGTAHVTLKWQAVPNAAAYHLEFAEDAQFTLWITDLKPMPACEAAYPDLPPGTYFWRVTAIDVAHREGIRSPIHQFEVEPVRSINPAPAPIDDTPPKLDLERPSVHGRFVIIKGTSEISASIWVNGQYAFMDHDSGKFVFVASMPGAGTHSIHVLAIDPAGHRSRKSVSVKIVE